VARSAVNINADPARSAAPIAAVLLLLLGLAASASADESTGKKKLGSLVDSTFTVALGGFFPRVSSEFSLNAPDGSSGGSVSIEDDLGLDKSTASAWVGFHWRFQPRHQVQLEWFQLNRDGESTAERTIGPIGDTTIGVGAGVSSKIDLNLGRVTYGYTFWRNEDWRLTFLTGLHVATFKATVTAGGNVTVNGVPVVSGTTTESTSTYTVPLPHFGGSVAYKISPRWSTNFTALAFALKIDNYGGSLVEIDANVAYQVSKHFGIGGGLKYFNLHLEANSDRGGGASYDYQFFGPAIFGYATF
jgi:hypothetical protein